MWRFSSGPNHIMIGCTGLRRGVPSTVFKLFSVLCKFGDDTLKIQAGILKILCGPQSIYYFQAGPRDEYTKQLVHLVSSFLKVQ
jgi:hypothetical protein